jgi:hypothetical protein
VNGLAYLCCSTEQKNLADLFLILNFRKKGAMKRRALIIYCSDTYSGHLRGPIRDNANYRNFLGSDLGGGWYDHEILSLANPTGYEVAKAIRQFLNGADYTFVIFTGHGYIDSYSSIQYIELLDKRIPAARLKTTALRQTIIIDACSGYKQHTHLNPTFYSRQSAAYIGDIATTRNVFDFEVMSAEPGIAMLYSANRGNLAMDTTNGGAYLLSLLCLGKNWEGSSDMYNTTVPLDVAHLCAKEYLIKKFNSYQDPILVTERFRTKLFPIFVKEAVVRDYWY